MSVPTVNVQLQSLFKSNGEIELALKEVPVPALADDEILVRIDASPINPTDLGLLLPGADLTTMTTIEKGVKVNTYPGVVRGMTTRLDKSMPSGSEGAGVVIATGSSAAAKALMGKVVATWGGSFFAKYRVCKAGGVSVMPEGITPVDAAAAFVNPLTVCLMIETMKMEGHKAIVHTAAASNLGQMLLKACIAEKIDLVTIVRSEEQAQILSGLGAKFVVNSSNDSFKADLTKAIIATGATLAFDAIGGGDMADTILGCMEAAVLKDNTEYLHYGSSVNKQVYIYGMLDSRPTTLSRRYGFVWGCSAWLLTTIMGKLSQEKMGAIYGRIARELKSTFASTYTTTISLTEAVDPKVIASYIKMTTGQKYLLNPHKA